MFAYVTNSTYAIVRVTSTICARFHFNLPHCDCMMSAFISKLFKILIDALTLYFLSPIRFLKLNHAIEIGCCIQIKFLSVLFTITVLYCQPKPRTTHDAK